MKIRKNQNRALTSVGMAAALLTCLAVYAGTGGLANAAETSAAELVVNGDMEKGNPPDSWVAGLGDQDRATLSADTDAHSGKQSLRISPLVNQGRATQHFPVKPETQYRFEFWYKGTTEVSGLYFYLSAGKVYPAGYYAATGSATTWTRWTGELSTVGIELKPDQTAQLGFCGWTGGDVLIDDVSVTAIKPGEAVAPVVAEAPVAVAPAVKPAATDAAREKARKGWLALFPGYKYLCWDKSPWDKLAKVQLPPTAERPGYEFPFQECKEISLAMGENEYESASFVLTNLSDQTAEFAITAKDAGLPTTIREAVWITTSSGKEVNDALPLLEGNLAIPPGESREVWLTLCSRGVKPGDYNPQLTIQPQADLPAFPVNLKVKIYPVSLPDDKPIYTFYWDYLVPEWTTPEVAQALTDDMKQHYVNTPTVHPWPARLQLNPDGTLKKDYQRLDQLLGYYQQLNLKMIVFSWNPEGYLMNLPGYPFFSAEWKTLFTSYLTGLVGHLKEKGLGYDQFAIHPYDEILDAKVYDMAKLIKEIDPKINLIVNATASPEEMKKISPYTDIFMPHLYNYLSQPGETRNLAVKLLSKSPKFFWTYANPVPPFPQMVSPYSIYRLAVWQAWSEGMGGHGNWIYSYKTHWNARKSEDGENWAMVYFANADDAPPGISTKEVVVTGKRWEATREGIEDYVYLALLKDATEKTGGNVSPESLAQAQKVLAECVKTVLGEMKNTTLADKAKEDILKALSKLAPADK